LQKGIKNLQDTETSVNQLKVDLEDFGKKLEAKKIKIAETMEDI
jgi:hypothetical protein